MCANYDPAAEIDFEAFTQFPKPNFDFPDETWKDYAAPILRNSADEYLTDPATFGVVHRKHIQPGVKVFDTMIARAENVGEKRSYSEAWKKLQLCLIHCRSFYEPSYETGSAVRWRLGQESGKAARDSGAMACVGPTRRHRVFVHDAHHEFRRTPAEARLS
jgi:putative SOS response-associated peptidase YedK